MYSDDGEILQVAYAKKAIDKAASVVAITDGRIGISLCRIPVRSRLHTRHPKINYNILQPAGASNRLLLCFTGLAGDVRHLLLDANTVAVSHRVSFGETLSPLEMSTQISRMLTVALHPSDDRDAEKLDRPLACEGFVMGIEKGEIVLFSCSNSGHFSRESVVSAGRMSGKMELIAAQLQTSGEGIQDAILLAAELILAERDQDSDDADGHIEMRVIDLQQTSSCEAEANCTEPEKQCTVKTFRTIDEFRELLRNSLR